MLYREFDSIRIRNACLGCLFFFVAGLQLTVASEPSSYFRHRQGVAADDRQPLPDQFDSDDVLVWRRELPKGQSTPCIVGDLILLTTHESDKFATVALDRATGQPRWRRVAPTERIEKYHPVGSPASATVASDGQRAYVFFGSYGLLCYDLMGNLVWSKAMAPFQDEFGSSSSPVLADGKVLLNEDHDTDNFLLALEAATGKTLWKRSRDGFTRSYSTPVIWQHGDTKQVLVAGALQLISYDLETGKPLWWVDGLARIVNTTPAVTEEMVYVATWSPGGDQGQRVSMEPWADAAKMWDANANGKLTREELPAGGPALQRFYRIDLNQDGGLDEQEWSKHARLFELAQNAILAIRPTSRGNVTDSSIVWKYDRGIPYVPSPLVYRGVVYLVKDGGIFTAMDRATGKVHKQARLTSLSNYYASPVGGDGKIYVASEAGVLTVVRAAPDWEILSVHDFAERTMATPVIDAGKVYVRTERALYCFQRP
jgi:outer membrane protein assembly factor BamB